MARIVGADIFENKEYLNNISLKQTLQNLKKENKIDEYKIILSCNEIDIYVKPVVKVENIKIDFSLS